MNKVTTEIKESKSYKPGDLFRKKGENDIYILARTDSGNGCFIGLWNGNRYEDPRDLRIINFSEFKYLGDNLEIVIKKA